MQANTRTWLHGYFIIQLIVHIGRDEAKSFERLMADLAEWFIDNPLQGWRQQMVAAAKTPYTQAYRY